MAPSPRPREARQPELRAFCNRLKQLHEEAGGPTLDTLARNSALPGKARISEILRAKTNSVPTWTFVKVLVTECIRYAQRHDTPLSVSVDLEYWRHEHEYLSNFLRRVQRPENAGNRLADELSSPESLTPQTLPADVLRFAGRNSELTEMDGVIAPPDGNPSALAMSVLSGTAGVGKTALAVHWAYRVRERFPDGQLFIDLHGYDRDEPVSSDDALAALLRMLGINDAAMPFDLSERSARYKMALAGRRSLVILDNAHSVDQIRPLLPGASTCCVVVTSRDSLAGLVAREGAHRISIDLLPPVDAIDLLRASIGRRVDEDLAAATKVVELCVRLPLALRVGAELIIARPGDSLADLSDELVTARHRLDLFAAGGDEQTAVRAVFSWSYRHLSTGAAQAFRLLGIDPCSDIDVYAAAHLFRADLEQARNVLDVLARAHLVQRRDSGRFAMHDLLRTYAAERAMDDDGDVDRDTSLQSLLEFYISTTAAAMDVLYPFEKHHRPSSRPISLPIPLLSEPAKAKNWLDAERANLVKVTVYAATMGSSAHAGAIAALLRRYLDTGAHYKEGVTIFEHALQAATDHGDRYTEALALHNLGRVYSRVRMWDRALPYYRHSLPIRRSIGDKAGESDTLNNLGNYYRQVRYFERALQHYHESLELSEEIEDDARTAVTLNNIGTVLLALERFDEAGNHFERALVIALEIESRLTQGHAFRNIGTVHSMAGRLTDALDNYRRALDLAAQLGDRVGLIDTLRSIGSAYVKLGQHEAAAESFEQALDIAREIGNAGAEADVLDEIGTTQQNSGRWDEALVWHRQAFSKATEVGDFYQEARALEGIATALDSIGRPDEARISREAASRVRRPAVFEFE